MVGTKRNILVIYLKERKGLPYVICLVQNGGQVIGVHGKVKSETGTESSKLTLNVCQNVSNKYCLCYNVNKINRFCCCSLPDLQAKLLSQKRVGLEF